MPNISSFMQEAAILLVPLLLALVCHEVGHGLVAYALGDPTAKNAGRLTLNPLKHLDPLGTIAFFLVNIGWAKPVPVDPRYFKNPQKGMLLVAMAGPGTNFVLAVLFALAFHLLASGALPLPQYVAEPLLYISQAGVAVNLILGVFNLIPVPPLDGSNIVAGLLPRSMAYRYMRLGRYGMFLIFGLFLISHFAHVSLLGAILFPPVRFAASLLGVPV